MDIEAIDRELELRLASSFISGFLEHSDDSMLANMLKVAQSSMEFEIELMTSWEDVNWEEMCEDW